MVIQELKYIGAGSGRGAGGGRGIKVSGLSIKAVTATLMDLVLWKNDLENPTLDPRTRH